MSKLSDVFPACRSLLGPSGWRRVLAVAGDGMLPDGFPILVKEQGEFGGFPFLSGLARLELALFQVRAADVTLTAAETTIINPTVHIIPLEWTNVLTLLSCSRVRDLERIKPGNEFILVWQEPSTGEVLAQTAEPGDLLAIKLVAEEIDPESAARQASVPVGKIDAVMRDAVSKGLLISPASRLRRELAVADLAPDQRYVAAEVFTLQWHLTQQCDLHCRHCYDRSQRSEFPFGRALEIMDELRSFCRKRFVRGQISLTGGNPLLYPRFYELYRAAVERDFMIAILGNAADRHTIEQIVALQMPVYYQVSLEGLESHNDEIRGGGNYRRTIAFLRMLSEMGVPNMVMLTLTRKNMDQIVPLAAELENITGGLTFNRLALFGEGAALELPTPGEYRAFLEMYVRALEDYPVLSLKDSLINTVFESNESGLFGGCAGYGCGAAFNFISILSDGEAHACRKFPSPIGNILAESLETIYASQAAVRYRAGSSACSGCRLNAVCRGCPAVTASLGLNPFTEKDPYCFRRNETLR